MATYRLAVMADDVIAASELAGSALKNSYLVIRDDVSPMAVYARFVNQVQAQKTVDALNLQGT